MDKRNRLFIIIAIIVLIISLYFISQAITKYTGYAIMNNNLDNFAKCLTEKDSIIYFSSIDCENCLVQKEMFGSSWRAINVTNCDDKKYQDKAGCITIKVTREPTWLLNNRLVSGGKDLQTLSNITQCTL